MRRAINYNERVVFYICEIMEQYLDPDYIATIALSFMLCIERDKAFTNSWLFDRYQKINTELVDSTLLSQPLPDIFLKDFVVISTLIVAFAFDEKNLTWAEFETKTENDRKKMSSCVFLEPLRLF